MAITDADGLRRRIRELQAEDPTRYGIRDALLAEIQGDLAALTVVAEVALLDYVARVTRQPDATLPVPPPRGDWNPTSPRTSDTSPSHERWPAAERSARRPATFSDQEGNRYGSPVAAARADIKAEYLKRVHVSVRGGPNPQDEKFLADLDAVQLRFAAGVRRTAAANTLAVADTYDRLADALDKARVTTVAELDPEIGLSILTGTTTQQLREAG